MRKPTNDRLEERLREHRLRHSLTKRAMAERLGVWEPTYRRWEAGHAVPAFRARVAIRQVLGPPRPDGALTFGAQIREWRLAQGLTLVQGTRRVGLDPKTLHAAELGRRATVRTEAAIRSLLGEDLG